MDSRLNALAFIAQPEESVTKIDRRDPQVMKQVSCEAISAAQKAPCVARDVASELHHDGVLPLFPQVASVLVPTAAYCSDRYNQTVVNSEGKGYNVASYLPLVPAHKIAKLFRERSLTLIHCYAKVDWHNDFDKNKKLWILF
ncbi:REF/SRPP-like protein At3g05500 [Gossypium hirsutum]|uniref:REF/SRPP-like protein At3g05500 n=1 Tax=Gossypium hirsutum TaxID=3635 RepID=A0A1U8PDM4_GOSHI|nr:REF/SRPP-like protein At3g05500 [Gossypium hirsutum]